MAVIIQVMILSDISGVTFTADPVSGAENVIITEASFGMGAAIDYLEAIGMDAIREIGNS